MAGGGRKNIPEYVGIVYSANYWSMKEIWPKNCERNTFDHISTSVHCWRVLISIIYRHLLRKG
jgi:hypothetical protein